MKNLATKIYVATLVTMLAAFVSSAVFAEAGPTAPPAAVSSPVPTVPSVTVAEPAAPPEWAQEIIVAAEKLPVIGPVVSKALLWCGILAGILTTLTAALLTVISTLMGVANLSGLVRVATALTAFRDGKVMYWLKFFSMFNAKKQNETSKA